MCLVQTTKLLVNLSCDDLFMSFCFVMLSRPYPWASSSDSACYCLDCENFRMKIAHLSDFSAHFPDFSLILPIFCPQIQGEVIADADLLLVDGKIKQISASGQR